MHRYCRSDPLKKTVCGNVRDDRLQHFWITLMCMSAVGFIIKVLMLGKFAFDTSGQSNLT